MIRAKIDRILNRFGYYYTGIPKGVPLTEADVMELFQAYGESETFIKFLRDLSSNDVGMYFQATNDDDRRTIRGANQRTNYFIALIRKSNDKRKRKRN